MERLDAARTTVIHPLLMRATDGNGRLHEFRAINEVSIFRRELSGRAAAHSRRRQGTAGRTCRRRHPGRDARRLDRLQFFGSGADHSDRRAAARADADQPVPSAPLAWRTSARQGASHNRNSRRVQAAGGGRRRSRSSARACSRVDVSMDQSIAINLLFDPDHSLDERILREQFGY